MGAFFKPLRRKLGVATLGLACVLVVGWARGQVCDDTIALCNGSVIYYFSSTDLGFELEIHPDVPDGSPERKAGSRNFMKVWEPAEQQNRLATWAVSEPFFGIRSAKIRPTYRRIDLDGWRLWIIPHSHVVLPLTLLSAWLLLSKLRTKKSPEKLPEKI